MQRAKRLLEGLRIHHLGFGFFWTVTFIVLAGFQGAGAVADYWQIYILTEQTLMPLAVGALGALCAFRRCELPHWTASAASFMLSGAALLYFLAFHFGQSDGAIATVAGVLMGGSCALFFLLWEMFYVTEGQQRALICIPLSAAMSVALYLLIRLLPPVAVALAAVCVLPFLALLCLQKSLAEIEADATAPLTRPALRRAVGDLWRPALCVSILGFRGSSSPASSRPKAPAAPRCSSDSRRRPFWWWPSSCFFRRASTSCISARCSSPREIEVAELLMKGHTVSAIAGKLFISENTTRGHAKSIYKKLDIHSRQELVDLDDQLTRA